MVVTFIQLGVLDARGQERIINKPLPIDGGLAHGTQLVRAIGESTHRNVHLTQQRLNAYDGLIFDCHGKSLPKSLRSARLT